MNLSEPRIAELQQEAGTTRKLLKLLPPNTLDWKPHPKSRALGEVAAHIADLPGLFIAPLDQNEFDFYSYRLTAGGSAAGILAAFDRNIADALERLSTLSDEQMLAS